MTEEQITPTPDDADELNEDELDDVAGGFVPSHGGTAQRRRRSGGGGGVVDEEETRRSGSGFVATEGDTSGGTTRPSRSPGSRPNAPVPGLGGSAGRRRRG